LTPLGSACFQARRRLSAIGTTSDPAF
jgi:hypothetical protein